MRAHPARSLAAAALVLVLAVPAAAGPEAAGPPAPEAEAARGTASGAAAEARPAAGGATAREGWLPAPPDADARAIAEAAEEALRADTTVAEATMTVRNPRLPAPRVVRFRWWDDRRGDRAFIRILEPPRDAGTGFLRIERNLWMYVPRVERTMRIPPSLMHESWMGSDFTHDDLVRESSPLEDYDHAVLGIDPDPEEAPGRRAWVLEYRPHEDAPVVWGRIVAWIDMERLSPLRQEFFDEDGTKLRVLTFHGAREVAGRWFPHRWVMRPLDKEGHETRVDVHEIRFDVPIGEEVFTLRHLREWP